MDGSFAECSVEDKPVDCMPNVTRVRVEDNAFYHEIVQPKCIVLSVVSLVIIAMLCFVCAFIDPCRG